MLLPEIDWTLFPLTAYHAGRFYSAHTNWPAVLSLFIAVDNIWQGRHNYKYQATLPLHNCRRNGLRLYERGTMVGSACGSRCPLKWSQRHGGFFCMVESTMQCEVLYTDVEKEKQRRGTRSCESRESEGSTNPPEDFEDPLPLTDDVATSNNFSSSSSL